MRHRLLTGLFVFGFGLGWSAFWDAKNIHMTQAITQTPVSTDDLRVFPGDLVCGKREETLNEDGPSWVGIIVGKSSLADVRNLLSTFSNDYEFIEDNYNTRFIDPKFLHETEFPSSIRLCLQDETAEVIAVAYNSPLSVPRPNLNDLVAEFGLPDAVTWTENPASRIVFWFSQGFATVVTVIPNETDNTNFQPTFGRITEEIYFPYQEIEGYEDRWPYNQTRKFNEFLMHPEEADFGPENPFDFEEMIAKITAEQSRTPTPTFAPISSIPTATP